MGLITFLCVPSLTSLYLWSFFLIPVMFFINSGKKASSKNTFFFVMMISLFVFTVGRFNSRLTINSFLIYVATAIISIVAVIDTVSVGVKKIREIKSADQDIIKE